MGRSLFRGGGGGLEGFVGVVAGERDKGRGGGRVDAEAVEGLVGGGGEGV